MSDVPGIRPSLEPRTEVRIPEEPVPPPVSAPRPREVEVTERTPAEGQTVGTQLDVYA